jgi:regulator of sigma E protease
LAAGVSMNIILAWLILTFFYLFGGKAIISGMDSYKGVTNSQHVYITEVVKGSPAEKSGLKVGDTIVSVAGSTVRFNNEVFDKVQTEKAKNASSPVAIVILRDGANQTLSIDTYKEKIDGTEVQRVGISMAEAGKTQAKWYLAPIIALRETFRLIGLTLAGLWSLLVSIFTKGQIGDQVGGPVAIYSLSGIFASIGFWALAQFIAILSISLALINILPFPALDGGHIAILIVEAVRGKKIKDSTKQAVNNIGFGLLLLLMVSLVFRDLTRLSVFEKIKGIFK